MSNWHRPYQNFLSHHSATGLKADSKHPEQEAVTTQFLGFNSPSSVEVTLIHTFIPVTQIHPDDHDIASGHLILTKHSDFSNTEGPGNFSPS